MNLTLRTRIFIVISLVILIILAISIALVVMTKKSQVSENTLEGNTTTAGQTQTGEQNFVSGVQPTVINQDLPIKPQTTEEKMRSAAENLAKIFTEKYGSYSTDNPGQNLKELESLSSSDLWKILQGKIGTMAASEEFAGITTHAFGSSVISYTDDKAVVKILSTREENKNGTVRKYNQEAEVTLIKNGSSWLVDDIKWQ